MHTSERHPAAHSCGFSLIELMVMLTIAAILTAVTLPGYVYEIRKARRTDARFALLDLATREERFFSTNSTYTSNPADLGYAGAFPQTVGGGYYQLTVCVANTAPCGPNAATATGSVFLLTATPVGTQASDTQCTSFTLDNLGVQSATGSSSGACWSH